ncbi:MAG: YlmC/YmxH family sporulation protein [Clostridia bacterium]|nr:YlmC/YmxH family sporulation protein [Clostridia bacterium]
MELSFSDLRAKEVINTQDGKRLGRVCDLVFCYPENKILGIVVPGGRSFAFKKEEFFIDLRNVVKIGDDVILVNVSPMRKCPPTKQTPHASVCPPPHQSDGGRRSYEEYE